LNQILMRPVLPDQRNRRKAGSGPQKYLYEKPAKHKRQPVFKT